MEPLPGQGWKLERCVVHAFGGLYTCEKHNLIYSFRRSLRRWQGLAEEQEGKSIFRGITESHPEPSEEVTADGGGTAVQPESSHIHPERDAPSRECPALEPSAGSRAQSRALWVLPVLCTQF